MMGYLYAVLFYILLAGGGYLYYQYASTKIESLQTSLTLSESQLKAATDAVNRLASQVAETNKSRNTLTIRLSQSEASQRELIRSLQEHDLTKLAAAKPGLVEKILNEETREVFDSIESATSN